MSAGSITCRELTKRFGTVTAVSNLTLSVPAGSVFGFLGPNGAGKSTTIRILTTLSRPSSGDAEVGGSSVTRDPSGVRRVIGYLPQEPAFPGWMSGSEYLRFQAGLVGVPARERSRRVDEALDLVDLTTVGKRRVGGYSGGMKQRLGIAQAMIGKPAVLILDEPVSSLDPIGRREVIQFIETLRGQVTVFFSSHILTDIEGTCDQVAILDDGKLLTQNTVSDLKEMYAEATFLLDVDGDTTSLSSTLRQLPWVRDIDRHGGHLRILVSDPSEARQALPRAVLDTGATMLRYEQVLPTLEEIFVRLVGRTDVSA